MPDDQSRSACPVCHGVVMTKLRPVPQDDLVLDYCARCGGIWFDEGEVEGLRRSHPDALAARVKLRDEAYRAKCRGCGASLKRNDERCWACGRSNRIDCPSCHRELDPVARGALRLDRCGRCRGVWFDNIELSEIWNDRLAALAAAGALAHRRPPSLSSDRFPLDALLFLPDPGPILAAPVDVAAGAGTVAQVAGSAFSGVVELAGSAIEHVPDLAASVFEAIAALVEGLLSGVG